MIFLESAGRPDVMAGPDAGIGRRARPDHPLDRHRPARDVGRPAAEHRADEQDQALALAAADRPPRRHGERRSTSASTPTPRSTARRGTSRSRSERFGDPELAVVSYHMGIGNLESVLRAYAGDESDTPIGELVKPLGAQLPARLLRLRARVAPQGLRAARRVRRRVVAVSVEGARLEGHPERLARRSGRRSRRPPSWRPTRRRSRRSTTRPTRRRCSRSPDDISDAIDDGDLVAASRRSRARLGAGSRHRPVRGRASTSRPSSTGR